MKRVLVVLCVGCVACGSTATLPPPPAPSTALDPAPYVPTPTDVPAEVGTESAIAISGGESQARALAIRTLEAIRDGDPRRLEALLSPRMARVQPRPTEPRIPREAIIQNITQHPRRGEIVAGAPLTDYFDIARMQIQPLETLTPQVPRGLEAGDLVVYVPFSGNRRIWRVFGQFVGGWNSRASVLVRTGSDATVVGL